MNWVSSLPAGTDVEREVRRMITALRSAFVRPLPLLTAFVVAGLHPADLLAQRRMEHLDRGLVCIIKPEGKVFLSWRLLATDPPDITFNIYRAASDGKWIRRNSEPIAESTCFQDTEPHNRDVDAAETHEWIVRPVVNGEELEPSAAGSVLSSASDGDAYLAVPLQTPQGYTPNDASVGDLDGDGEYEIVIHQVGRGRDNAQRGWTSAPILQAYKLDGTFLWQINLGKNIREGAHYTQFIVYDLDSDGRSEIVCKTADGTIDGTGAVIGDAAADYRDDAGYVLDGPEFLTVFDGCSGAALETVDYVPPRGNVADWGDDYGNRVDRYLAAVAYLDGVRPSVVMCRGYYDRSTLTAWNWREGKLTRLWTFDSSDGTLGNEDYAGQGAHSLSVADVDHDGRDEIVYGACTIDDNGRGLYSTRLGHGDALHVSDLDAARTGLEVFNIHERARDGIGVSFRDARTGELLWSKSSPDVVRGIAMDIDPRFPGCESWAAGRNLRGLWSVTGEVISRRKPRSCNFGVWWDGDLLRELLDRNKITKWNWTETEEMELLYADDCAPSNGSKATPALCADVLGDWREEVIWRSADNSELRIYTTTIATEHRLNTLMHDPQYRLSVAWQNVAYNQPSQPGFYLGHGMSAPARPKIVTTPLQSRTRP